MRSSNVMTLAALGMLALVASSVQAAGPAGSMETIAPVAAQLHAATTGFHHYFYGGFGYGGFGYRGYGYSYARPNLYVGYRYPAYSYGWSSYRPYYYSGYARPAYYSPYAYYPRSYYVGYGGGVPVGYSAYYGSLYGGYAPYVYSRSFYTYPQGYYRYNYYTHPSYAAFAYPYGYPGAAVYRSQIVYGF